MALILRSDLKEKIKAIGYKGFPYVVSGIKTFATKKEEVFDLWLLDIKNMAFNPQGNIIKAETIDYIKNNLEIKILSNKDSMYRDEFVRFSRETALIPEELIETVLKKECVLFLALLNNRIVGSTCLALKEYPLYYLACDFILGDKQVYRFHSYVAKEYRRRGIMSFLWVEAINFAKDNGYDYMVAAIRPWNMPSSGLTEKLGFRKHATVSFSERFFIQKHNFQKGQDTDNKILSLRLANGKIVKF